MPEITARRVESDEESPRLTDVLQDGEKIARVERSIPKYPGECSLINVSWDIDPDPQNGIRAVRELCGYLGEHELETLNSSKVKVFYKGEVETEMNRFTEEGVLEEGLTSNLGSLVVGIAVHGGIGLALWYDKEYLKTLERDKPVAFLGGLYAFPKINPDIAARLMVATCPNVTQESFEALREFYANSANY